MNDLLKSRQFWTAIVGAVATLTVFFVGKYAFAALEDVQTVLNVLLPIVLVMIAAYTVDDVAKTNARAQVVVEEMRLQSLQTQVRLAAMEAKGVPIEK